MGKPKSEEYSRAYDLYCNSSLSQKEIAKVVEVSTVTLSNWATTNNWELDRNAKQVTAEKVIRDLYFNISDIQKKAREDKRNLSPAETDQIVKITGSIAKLRKRYDLSGYHSVLREALEWIGKVNAEAGKILGPLMLDFLKAKSNQLSNDKSIG